MLLKLPWPSSKLSPNARVHYQILAKNKALYKAQCRPFAESFIPVFAEGNIPLDITFHPPKNYRFDLDGLLSRIKAGIDLCAEVWGIDDYRFDPVTIRRAEKRANGEVVIFIDESKII